MTVTRYFNPKVGHYNIHLNRFKWWLGPYYDDSEDASFTCVPVRGVNRTRYSSRTASSTHRRRLRTHRLISVGNHTCRSRMETQVKGLDRTWRSECQCISFIRLTKEVQGFESFTRQRNTTLHYPAVFYLFLHKLGNHKPSVCKGSLLFQTLMYNSVYKCERWEQSREFFYLSSILSVPVRTPDTQESRSSGTFVRSPMFPLFYIFIKRVVRVDLKELTRLLTPFTLKFFNVLDIY